MSGPPTSLASQPAIRLFLVATGLHFTAGVILQSIHLPVGLLLDEIFLLGLPPLLAARAAGSSAELGFHKPHTSQLALTIAVALVGFLWAGTLGALNRLVFPSELAAHYDASRLFDGLGGLDGVLLFFVVAVAAPVCEELLFRGYLQPIFVARHGATLGIGLTSLLFALVHLNPVTFVALLALGVVFGLLRHFGGSLIPAIVAHAIQNGISASLVLAGADTPDEELAVGPLLFALAVTTPAVLALLRLYRRRAA